MSVDENKLNPRNQNNNELDKNTKLILFNDDVNSFDFVIESLMEVCDFEDTQAAQLALIAHYKGKTTLKEGQAQSLLKMQEDLMELGLTVEMV